MTSKTKGSGNGNRFQRRIKNHELRGAGKTDTQTERLNRGPNAYEKNIKNIVKEGPKGGNKDFKDKDH